MKDTDIDCSDIPLTLDWSNAEMGKYYSRKIGGIRRSVRQGIAEIERGEGQEYQGKKGIRRFFSELRTEAHRELQAERPKKAKRK